DWIVNAADQSFGYGDRSGRGHETLRDAVDRVVRLDVAEFSHDVAVAQNDAVGRRALRGEGAKHLSEGAYLVFVEVPFRAVGFGPVDGFLEFRGVHTNFTGRLVLPGAFAGEVGILGLTLRDQS